MKKLTLILLIPLAFSIQVVIAQNAPISTIGTIETYGTTAVVPITVTGFTNIGGCDLKINYDSSIATATSVSLGPGIGAMYFIGNTSIPGEISISWLFFSPGIQGVTLPDNSVLFNITFDRTAYGYSALEFDFNHPLYCEYIDWEFAALNDTPNSTYYLNGSVTFAGGTQWTGNIDDDWSDALNWTSGVPGDTTIAEIINVSPYSFPSATTNAECLDLDIASGASVTIPESSTLTVYGNVNNNGQLTVESTSAGDGSFINYGTISGTGSAKVGRYLVSEQWHYVSPSISDGLSGIFLDIWLKSFDEVSGTYSYIVPTNIPLNPMQGYGAWADNDLTGTTTVYYEGSLNTGSVNSGVLTYTSAATHNHRGYNLVGNPYPSAVDWDIAAGWTKTNIDAAIYVWNPSKGNYGSYVAGVKSNDLASILPAGQGFIVHVNSSFSTGALTVNNDARLHSNDPFYKNSDNSVKTDHEFLKLEISSEANSFSDQAIIQFQENSTDNFDPSYDAYDITGLDEAPNLYSVSADEANLSINSYSLLDENIIIPLDCTVGIDGFYTIEALEILNFPVSTQVLLEDKSENTIVDFVEQDSYTFYASAVENPDRFNLHFLLTQTNTIEPSENEIKVYTMNNTICVKQQSSNMLDGSINVFDVLGRLIVKENVKGVNLYELPIDENGIFIISYFDNTDRKEYRQKVHLK